MSETNEEWLRAQPWYVRLDEWQHARIAESPAWFTRLWIFVWSPLCTLVDRHYMRGLP